MWIEITPTARPLSAVPVAPHSGAWIEMEKDELKLVNTLMSHPTQVRSLK